MPATLRHPSNETNLDPNLSQPATGPDHSLPGDNSLLEEQARKVGAALGRMVATFRHAGIRIRHTAAEATDTAASQITGAKQQIRSGYVDAKARARIMVRDYPLHVVLGAGLFGVMLGAGLRIWRANR